MCETGAGCVEGYVGDGGGWTGAEVGSGGEGFFKDMATNESYALYLHGAFVVLTCAVCARISVSWC